MYRIGCRQRERWQKMNAQHADYSLILGVVSAVIVLCFMLTVWYGAKTLWKSHRKAQLERQWRKQ